MKNEPFVIQSEKNPNIAIEVTKGHFATNSSHISHYLDMTALKTNINLAKNVARELAIPYEFHQIVDTIVCMEGTVTIGAFFADELRQNGTMMMNSNSDLNVITPQSNVNGQLIFLPNQYGLIRDKKIILLLASVSSGRTVSQVLECLEYYGGILVGISALFTAVPEIHGHEIFSIFTEKDVPDYQFAPSSKCEMCRDGQKLEALVNSDGYMELDAK